ncbi:MAG: hypothetical protein IJU57_05505 [Clostridia bacterium]|nr:hypothetical protein [Clostridia bacterium]
MNARENAAYVKGLIEGMKLNTETNEGKAIKALCDLCEKMAEELDALKTDVDTAFDYLDELDEDLGAAEEILYDIDEDDCCCDECDDDCCDDDDEDDEDEEDEEEAEFYCAMCPHCGGKVYFDDTMDPEEVFCPKCHKCIVEEEEEDTDQ